MKRPEETPTSLAAANVERIRILREALATICRRPNSHRAWVEGIWSARDVAKQALKRARDAIDREELIKMLAARLRSTAPDPRRNHIAYMLHALEPHHPALEEIRE